MLQYTMTEMASLTRQEVRDSCESKVQRLVNPLTTTDRFSSIQNK